MQVNNFKNTRTKIVGPDLSRPQPIYRQSVTTPQMSELNSSSALSGPPFDSLGDPIGTINRSLHMTPTPQTNIFLFNAGPTSFVYLHNQVLTGSEERLERRPIALSLDAPTALNSYLFSSGRLIEQ